MNDRDPINPEETLPDQPASNPTPGPSDEGSPGHAAGAPPPPASEPNWSAPTTNANQVPGAKLRRVLAKRKRVWIVAAAVVVCLAIGLCVGLTASSPSVSASPPTSTAAQPSSPTAGVGGPRSGGTASNARSGPAAGGAAGTVGSVSSSSFMLTTSAGQKVTIDETSSTTYLNGTSSTSSSAITAGKNVLVLGTTDSTTITATQVIVESTPYGSSSSTAALVVPFQRGAPTTSKQVGQIPANWSQGSGTIVSGTTANEATEAALAAYPGGVVDRVVTLSNGDYNVHYIGVNWPHHVFLNQDFAVIGAE